MIEVNTSGTMGDAFIIILKLIHKGIKQINHHSVHDNIFTKIKEMYSLLGDIEVNTVKIISGDPILQTTIKGNVKIDETYTPFPEFDLPDVSRFNLPNDYTVVQLQSGINITRTPWRKLSNDNMKEVNQYLPIVVIGTDRNKLSFKSKDIIDLRNKTSMLESFSVINGAKEFYGPQGLLGFVALSQRVKSFIWLKHHSDEHAVNNRINRILDWKEYVNYKRT